MLENRTVAEVCRLLTHGGGLDINVGPRRTDEILQIAIAAATGGGALTLRGLGARLPAELEQIAIAGRGRVIFAD